MTASLPAPCHRLPSLPLPGLQLASFAIVVNQLKNIYDAFFLSECDRCRGTGLVTCPHVSRRWRGGRNCKQKACASPQLCWSGALHRSQPYQPALHPSSPCHLLQCHGTKTLRRRPGYLRTRDYGIVDDPRDSYSCLYCGPPSPVSQPSPRTHACKP